VRREMPEHKKTRKKKEKEKERERKRNLEAREWFRVCSGMVIVLPSVQIDRSEQERKKSK
jgi:hypothetical protein